MDDTPHIYSRCLQCGSEKVKIAGKIPFAHDDLVTCLNCGAITTYLDFTQTNLERITKMLKEGGEGH